MSKSRNKRVKKRLKNCLFCNDEFEYQRITAMYCSESCKQNAYRREYDPHLYNRPYPIHFELDQYFYEKLYNKALEFEKSPSEYMERLAKDTASHKIQVSLPEELEDKMKIYLDREYPDKNFHFAFNDWLIKLLEKLTKGH